MSSLVTGEKSTWAESSQAAVSVESVQQARYINSLIRLRSSHQFTG
jgi:hypothetical protein